LETELTLRVQHLIWEAVWYVQVRLMLSEWKEKQNHETLSVFVGRSYLYPEQSAQHLTVRAVGRTWLETRNDSLGAITRLKYLARTGD
jgi:hypothetical protein